MKNEHVHKKFLYIGYGEQLRRRMEFFCDDNGFYAEDRAVMHMLDVGESAVLPDCCGEIRREE